MRRPNRRQAGAAAALGFTGLSAYAATRYSPTPGAGASTAIRAAAHADDFIPSADTPRVDGRLTLIWFSEPE
jgi:hypothetical protein